MVYTETFGSPETAKNSTKNGLVFSQTVELTKQNPSQPQNWVSPINCPASGKYITTKSGSGRWYRGEVS